MSRLVPQRLIQRKTQSPEPLCWNAQWYPFRTSFVHHTHIYIISLCHGAAATQGDDPLPTYEEDGSHGVAETRLDDVKAPFVEKRRGEHHDVRMGQALRYCHLAAQLRTRARGSGELRGCQEKGHICKEPRQPRDTERVSVAAESRLGTMSLSTP